ncbi:hypothetical protein DFO66_103364 [Brevibacterium sanguinis]|uniref:Uncharacterized protein n=2 Tax=Brevibacterium TaxID=1696 RepID=A0A366IP01_9MICO|nr:MULTISPECIES: hypothetical protein [Brevibacterium]RBP66417.1 hypothetical protein DFO66_103364 [Brevibacterium sanguinis]RBP73069.1 hypothetical protein DFO65_103364 [Brevibacterium celere]
MPDYSVRPTAAPGKLEHRTLVAAADWFMNHIGGWRPIRDMPLTTVGCLVDILDRRRIHTGLTVQGISHHGGLVYIYTRFGVLASDDMKWRPHE